MYPSRFYSEPTMRQAGNRLLAAMGADTSRVTWIRNEHYSFWMRDPGPLFLESPTSTLRMADFRYTSYGVKAMPEDQKITSVDDQEGRADGELAEQRAWPVVRSEFVAEGGGLETNGQGLLMTIEETARQRNPGKTLAEIEREYLRLMGQKKLIWLKRMTAHDRIVEGPTVGNYYAGGANGHVDEVARFVDARTVLVAQIDEAERRSNPLSRLDFDVLNEYAATLEKATDLEGRPLRVIRVPSPDLNLVVKSVVLTDSIRRRDGIPGLKNGDTAKFVPAVSYLNFLVSNGVVLIPTYWKPGMPLREREKDEEVRRLFTRLYPNRKVVQINPLAVNWGGGGMHCVSQQQPDGR
ncbi:MAG: agmatine deiminase family protein [Sphingobacteriaceae bacterium]|nr:agmatine deiminase family protein [Cytophagaceae bacterium]